MSREMADAPSSYGVDLGAEASLVDAPDLRRLARKVQNAVERRRFFDGVAAGALVTLAAVGVVAGVGVALTRDASPASSLPPPTTAPAIVASCPACMCASTEDASTIGNVDVATTERVITKHVAIAAKPRASSTDLALEPTPAPSTTIAPVARVDREAGAAADKSRLRTELALYDAASHALARGELAAAASAAQTLRARYPDGPLAIEAGIVAVTALRDGGHRDEARALLVELRRDPRSQSKTHDLAALADSLGGNAVVDAGSDDDAPAPIKQHAKVPEDAP